MVVCRYAADLRVPIRIRIFLRSCSAHPCFRTLSPALAIMDREHLACSRGAVDHQRRSVWRHRLELYRHDMATAHVCGERVDDSHWTARHGGAWPIVVAALRLRPRATCAWTREFHRSCAHHGVDRDGGGLDRRAAAPQPLAQSKCSGLC